MRTKHKIFSVLVTLAIVASLFVVVAPTPASAAIGTVTVTATPATAGDVAGYTIEFPAALNVAAAGTINMTFSSAVTLPASISYTMVAVGGVPLTAADSVSVSGQSIIITKNAGGAVSPVVISQGAGIKNPAIAKTKASLAYPVSVFTSVDTTPVSGYIGVIPSYALSIAAAARLTPVTVTGKGWTPNSSILVTGGLSNASSGGIAAADGTFSVTAYPGAGPGPVLVTDGAGQTELYQTGSRVGPVVTVAWDYPVTIKNFTILPKITVTPTSGNIGSTFTIVGTDFSYAKGADNAWGIVGLDDDGNGTIDDIGDYMGALSDDVNIGVGKITMAGVALNAAALSLVTIDAFGTFDDFTTVLTVPAAMPGGAKTISVTDSSLLKTATTTFTVNAPSIALTPGSGEANTVVTVTGTNFMAADTIGTGLGGAIFWGTPGAGGVVWNTAVVTVNASGTWTASLRIPANAVNGVNPVVAITANGTVATYGFIVGGRALTVSPSSGPMGTTVVVTGGNMTPTTLIAAPNVKLAGAVWAGWPAAGVTTDSLGNIPAQTLQIPMGLATGPQTVMITDAAGIVATGVFTVTQPTISITPTSGYKGDTIVVTGSGWVPTVLGLVIIRINTVITVLATPDASGAFTASFTVPASAIQSNAISAQDNYLNGPPAATFTLAPASISINPTSGAVGTDVTLTGKGFLPQAGLSALTIGGVPVLPTTAVVTDEIGAFTAMFTVPGLAVGAQTVGATVGGVNVTAFFTISSTGASAKVQLKSISAQLIRVWGYTNGTWQMYDPADAVGSDLASLVAGAGYFVNVNAPCTLVYGGNSQNLVSGWNLIGWR